MSSKLAIDWRRRLQAIIRWPHLGFSLLLLFISGLHFASIAQAGTYLFDEIYYVPDARSIIANQGTLLPEHPPLGKIFIAEGMRIFGDNPWGWRFFAVVFGIAALILLYLICRRLKLSNKAVMITTFLFGLENLSFIQANVAMLDVYCLTLMLAALFLYLREQWILAGLFAGLSALAKLTGIAVLGVFVLYWLFTNRRQWRPLVMPIVTAAAAFIILMPLLEFTFSSELANPFQRIRSMLQAAVSLSSSGGTYVNISAPWDWLMNKGIIFYSGDPQYIAAISFLLTPLIIPVVLYLLYRTIQNNQIAWLGLSWFACNYLPWIAAVLFLGRYTYVYYAYPALIGIYIGLGMGLAEILDYHRERRQNKLGTLGLIAVTIYLAAYAAVFVTLSPLAPALINRAPV